MRTKTKSFFEDLFVIFIIGLIIYGIYSFFLSSDENELKFEEIKSSIEKKIENEVFTKSPISEEKSDEKVEEEKVEESINQTQKEEPLVVNNSNVEEKIEDKNEKTTEIIENIETKPIIEKEVITTSNTSTELDDKARIEQFYEQIRTQINSNIEKNIDKTLLKDKEALNIRLTVLKDGRYEQITLMEGNKDTFEAIRPSITKAFPVKIDDSLKSNFPRYFRMKIEF